MRMDIRERVSCSVCFVKRESNEEPNARQLVVVMTA